LYSGLAALFDPGNPARLVVAEPLLEEDVDECRRVHQQPDARVRLLVQETGSSAVVRSTTKNFRVTSGRNLACSPASVQRRRAAMCSGDASASRA
jgi:hypothetical protein